MQEPEGYINVGYYTIMFLSASQDMTMIVPEFGKFRYNRLHMEICAFVNIFQAKLGDMVGGINVIKTYIDDVLFLVK